MKTDRELLELAAKAAGLKINAKAQAERDSLIDPETASLWLSNGSTAWNPLTHDGDALRLAVKIDLAVIPYPIYGTPKHSAIAKIYQNSSAIYRGEKDPIEFIELHNGDALAATRRAIVLAAAKIGEAM